MKRLYLIILIFASLSIPAFAANSSWINTGVTGPNWSYDDNWSLGFIPGATSGTSNTDVATFNTSVGSYGISSTPITIDSNRNIGGISFDTGAGNYYIGTTAGNPLLLTSGGSIQILSTLTSTNAIESINAPLVIEGASGTYTFSNNSANGSGVGAGTLNFAGGITGGAAGNTVLTLNGSNTNQNLISGIIANGSATTLGITKSGTGTWVLTGDNTYSGNTNINAGILNIQNANALGSGVGSATVASGATLQIQGGIATNAEALTLNGTGVSSNGALENVSSNNTYTGLLTLGSDSRINSDAGTLTISNVGAITGGYGLSIGGAGNTTIDSIIGTGTGTLTKDGTGTLILLGANTFSGTTTISGGTLQVGNGGATGRLGSGNIVDNANLTIDLTTSPNVSEAISGSGSITQNGSGTVTLSGANTYSGATTVNSGTLEAGIINQAFGVGSAVSVGTATLDLGGYNETIGSLAGSGTVTNSGITSPAILTTGGNNGSTSFSGNIQDGVSTIGLTKTGNGKLTLTGDNNYSGNTTVSAGTLNIQNSNAMGNGTGSVSVSSGATLQLQGGIAPPAEALTINGTGGSSNGALESVSGNNTYAGLITLGSSSQINADAGSLLLSNVGTITGAGFGLTVGGAGNTTIDSIIATGAGALTKQGSGTLTLSGVNTFTGGVNFNGGVVNATTLSNLGNGGALTFNGGTLQFGGVFDPSSSTMTFNAGGAIIDTNNQNITFANAVGNSGAGGLTKIGEGTLVLSGLNTYSGPTIVNGGILSLGTNGTLGSSTAALSVNNLNTGAGTNVELDLATGASTTTGSLSGAIATPSSGTNTLSINNEGQTFTVNQSVDGTFAGVISGSGAFILGNSSAGTLTLSGDNTYSGGTTIGTGSTLAINKPDSLGAGAVVNNGTLSLGTTSLALGGAYTQSIGSTLQLTIASASSFGNITTAVASAVAAGSTVSVQVGYPIANNQSFEIISTQGSGITGGAPEVTSSSSLITFASSLVNGNIYLTASNPGFTSVANNPNAVKIASVLENVSNPSTDMSNVLSTLVNLSGPKIASALNTMGPIVDQGVIQNSSAALNNFISATLDRIQSNLDHITSISSGVSSGDHGEENGVWAKPYGSYLNQGTLQGIQGYDAWNAGTVVGYDRMVTDAFTVGISGGYAYGQVNSDVNSATTDINSAQGTLYAGFQDPNLNYFIDAAGSFGWNWYDGKRDILVGNINRIADASYNGQQYSTYLEGGDKFNFGDHIRLTPLASIQWTHLSLDQYTETNAGALDLNVHSQGYDTLESGLGASVSFPMQYDWGNFTPEFHAKWLHDFINDDMAVTSSFTGGGGSFTTNGASTSKNGTNIGGKLSFDLNNNFSLIAEVDAELKNEFFGIYGSGTVRYKF